VAEEGFSHRRAGRFMTTRWSLVLAAGEQPNDRSADALARLCEMYWYPVYAFIRRQGCSPDDSADLTQEFFARVLEKHYFRAADPARGRFRAFLCASIRHFLSNERDRSRALKRGGPQPPIPLDVQTAERSYQLEPRDDLTPEKLFDRRWALVLLDRVLSRLRDEQVTAGKGALFDQLKGFLIGDGVALTYFDVAKTMGTTEGAIKVAVHRLRHQFRDALVDEIAETVSGPEEIDAEIAHLLTAVSV
jgi:RNA polymerase sigma factor (sigma-70 family)